MTDLTPAIHEALARGRDANNRMAGATSDDDYLNAAAQLGEAFIDLDRLLAGQE